MSAPFKTKIAGFPHRRPQLPPTFSLDMCLKVGDTVALVPEPTNKFDPDAIKVVAGDIHLGYIPRGDTHSAKGIETMYVHEVMPSRKWEEVTIANYAPAMPA